MASENITLYIKGDRNVEVTEQDVFLKDIVSMECSDKKFLPKLQTVKILKLHGNREQRYVVSVLEIIACIHAAYPEVEVQNLGEADIIVTYVSRFSGTNTYTLRFDFPFGAVSFESLIFV